MPIENERKYVLDDLSGALEARLAAAPGVTRAFLRQAYLEAPGLRIRSIETLDNTRHIFGYKRTINDQMVEIETEISKVDFERLWTLRRETLQKVRFSWRDGPFHWDADFFKGEDGRTYFAMAEVEMPEDHTEPPAPPPILVPHVLLLAPRSDPAFTSKRLADRSHAERLLASIQKKGAAA
jgi:CYTH domain-containing protein